MSTTKIKKGQIIQRKNDLNTKAYLIKSGLLRGYTIDEKGKEHIFMFAPEGWIIGDACSKDTPCNLFIDALEDTDLTILEKDVIRNQPETDSLFKRIEVLQNRVLMLMSSSATERYLHFTETYPEIIQRVPQKMIASYLGITPEGLSRVRKEI